MTFEATSTGPQAAHGLLYSYSFSMSSTSIKNTNIYNININRVKATVTETQRILKTQDVYPEGNNKWTWDRLQQWISQLKEKETDTISTFNKINKWQRVERLNSHCPRVQAGPPSVTCWQPVPIQNQTSTEKFFQQTKQVLCVNFSTQC